MEVTQYVKLNISCQNCNFHAKICKFGITKKTKKQNKSKTKTKTKTKTKQNVPRIVVRWKFWGVSRGGGTDLERGYGDVPRS